MSQKKEKYARSMEKRVGKLEDRVDKMDTELTAHAIRLYNIEDDLAVYNAAMSAGRKSGSGQNWPPSVRPETKSGSRNGSTPSA